ncbi:MAG: hypothetical protein CW716_12145 [Candidatus Bathyarchaeum sp.]|nr:MAG: hypothetical protein CW716_12145 [Candidatus Bathyarchaeum sp.]
MEEKFATAINCMDGRIQFPVINYLITKLGIDFVDVITEPGPNKILSEGTDLQAIERIKQCVGISIKKHGSKFVAMSAHHDCAGNPEEKESQVKQLLSSIEVIKSWNFDVKIIGLWIDDQWKTNEITFK